MTYSQALRTVKNGKKEETTQSNIIAAMKVINVQRNRRRVTRLKRLGYSDSEVTKMLYAAP